MKKSIQYLLLMLMSTICQTQSEALLSFNPELCDSLLMIQKEDGDIEAYSRLFKKLRKSLVSIKDPSLYKDARMFLEWLPQSTKADSAFIRREYYLYGYYAYKTIGDLNNAQFSYQVAHDYGGNLDSTNNVWHVEGVLASLYNMTGDHELSEYYYNILIHKLEEIIIQTEDLQEKRKYQNFLARSYSKLGFLYNWQEKYLEAEQTIQKGYNISRAHKSYLGTVSAASFLIHKYIETNRFELADKYLEILKNDLQFIPVDRQPEKWMLYYDYLGQSLLSQGRFKDAIKSFHKVDSVAIENEMNQKDRHYAKIQSHLSKCYIRSHQLSLATTAIKKGLDAIGINEKDVHKVGFTIPFENTFAELMEDKTDLYLFKYNTTNSPLFLDSAQMALQLSIKVFDALRDQYILNGSQLQSIAENKRLVNKSVDILWERYNHTKNNGLIKEAQLLFSRSKNLLVSQLENEKQTVANLPQGIKDSIDKHQEQILQLTSRFDRATEDEKKQIQDNIVEARSAVKNIIGKIIKNDHSSRPTGYIEYLWGTNYLYSLDDLNGTLRFHRLIALENLKPLLQKSQKGILEKDTSQTFYANQNHLYKALLGHVEIKKQLTLYPDDQLNYLSFASLVIDTIARDFLLETCLINLGSPSTTKEASNKKLTTLTTINPNYPKVSFPNAIRGQTLYHLPYALEEINTIKEEWNGKTTSYEGLTKKDFFEIFGKSQWLHFSGHALIKNDQAYLTLGSDSTLWVSDKEIAQIPASFEKVILSACETGLGQISKGEGVNSLANSFLLNGTKSIIYSLWAVNDQTTATLMKYLYQYQKLPFHQALGKAQRTYLRTASNEYRHPYYWAAFVASDNTINPSSTYSYTKFFMFLGAFFILFLFLFKIRKS